MLKISRLKTGYGETQVVHGIDLSIEAGQFHALLGRNGVGKSTTLKAIVGLLPAFDGQVSFDGQKVNQLPPFERAKLGISYVPETRDVFGSLTVLENLNLAKKLSNDKENAWTIERVFDFFPSLANRKSNGGNQLSGGEQQMLAIGRALLMGPRLLILDEPTEGLAPIIIRQIFEKLQELKGEGLTILLVEQNFQFATQLADVATLLGRGECVWTGNSSDLIGDQELHEKWLGV